MKKEKKKHSKKYKIIVTSIVLTSIAILGTCAGMWFGYTDPNLKKEMNYDSFYSNWMSNLKDDAKITQVVLPGSHDAGTNGMMPQAICQGHDIKDQLKGGVRYFDVRVTSKKDDLVIFHGPIKGQKFSKVIKDFSSFIAENPSEFIILDFQHLGDGVNQKVINMIKEYMPMQNMLPYGTYPKISDVTMSLLREKHYNFMITWKNNDEALANNFYTRENALLSQYTASKHKESDEALIKEFDNYYKNHDSERLFVLQAQRTAKTLLGKPSMYEKEFKDKVNKFIFSLKDDPEKLAKTNIIMRDFIISDKKNVNTILNLNLVKTLIKDTSISTFETYVK